MIRRTGKYILIAVLIFWASGAWGQTRPNPALARGVYNSLKLRVKPQGDLKAALDALDRELGEAFLAGKTGEARRLLEKGIALLSGGDWTDALDFSTSLVLRAEEICLDSSRPFTVRIEQIYSPRIRFSGSLIARFSLNEPEISGDGIRPGKAVKDLGTFDGVSRDLLDEPFRAELDPAGILDGPYLLRAEILDKDQSMGSAQLRVDLRRGSSERMRALEAGLSALREFDSYRADVFFPLDRIRNINRGRIEMGGFQTADELQAAENLLAVLKAGRDPFKGRTGDMKRHYLLESAGEIMPYRIYVPSKYDGKNAFPLIIALHGLGANENSFFEAYGARLPKLAEERGYIVAGPLGYRTDGGYGISPMGIFGNPEDVGVRRRLESSEKDVLAVIELMKTNYKIDESRIYLLGHSMGGIGTWHLGTKHPEIWAALAPFSGYGFPATVAAMKHIPEIVVHGGADLTVPVISSRAMVAEMKRLGVEHIYIEVPGGDHINVVEPNLAAVVDFFDKHRKKAN